MILRDLYQDKEFLRCCLVLKHITNHTILKSNFGPELIYIKKQIFSFRSVFTRLDENRDIQCVLEESFIFLTERSSLFIVCFPWFLLFFRTLFSMTFGLSPSNLCFFLLFSLLDHILSIFVLPGSFSSSRYHHISFSAIIFFANLYFYIFQVWLLAKPEANVCRRRREDDAKDVNDGRY